MGQLKSKAIRHRLPIRASLQINAVQERFLELFKENDDEAMYKNPYEI